MAKNNRELSQLAAFIGIEDYSQENAAGGSFPFNQVVAIGASIYSGTDEAPAVGIGTTNVVKAFQVASRDGSLFSKVQDEGSTQHFESPTIRFEEANKLLQQIASVAAKTSGFNINGPELITNNKNWIIGTSQNFKIYFDLREM